MSNARAAAWCYLFTKQIDNAFLPVLWFFQQHEDLHSGVKLNQLLLNLGKPILVT